MENTWKDSKAWRLEGYATIFRDARIYLVHRETGAARSAPVDKGRWMRGGATWRDEPDAHKTFRATLQFCYCDKGVDTCDFCAGVRRPPEEIT